jgi:hypothetical protein
VLPLVVTLMLAGQAPDAAQVGVEPVHVGKRAKTDESLNAEALSTEMLAALTWRPDVVVGDVPGAQPPRATSAVKRRRASLERARAAGWRQVVSAHFSGRGARATLVVELLEVGKGKPIAQAIVRPLGRDEATWVATVRETITPRWCPSVCRHQRLQRRRPIRRPPKSPHRSPPPARRRLRRRAPRRSSSRRRARRCRGSSAPRAAACSSAAPPRPRAARASA